MNRNFSNNSGRGADFDYANQQPIRRTTSTATHEEMEHGKSWMVIMGCFLAVLIVVSEVAKHAHLFN